MPASLRCFISSTCNDLFQERRNIAENLLEMGHTVILSEMPEKMPVNPRLSCVSSCMEAIELHADLIILIISGEYGTPQNDGFSVTEKEYFKARQKGVPIISFVRQKVWDLLPLYKNNQRGDFSPTVNNNKVFELIGKIASHDSGNWIFPFVDAQEINKTLKYQLSCMVRQSLNVPSQEKGIVYEFVNNYAAMMDLSGKSFRTLEYLFKNQTDKPIERLMTADMSDLPLTEEEFNLEIFSTNGESLSYEFLINTPNYKRWEVIFEPPIMPNQSYSFYLSHASGDINQMQTGHSASVKSGFIKYLLLAEVVTDDIIVSVRGKDGWFDNPPQAKIKKIDKYIGIFYPYQDITGGFQIRIKW